MSPVEPSFPAGDPAAAGNRADRAVPGLVVVSQPGRAPLHVLVVGQLEVGRECDGLLVTDHQVSRRHLRLELADGALVVADLGSSNGTYVDGIRLRAPMVLEASSTVTLGSTSIRLHVPAGGAAATTRLRRRADAEPDGRVTPKPRKVVAAAPSPAQPATTGIWTSLSVATQE